MNPSTKLAPTNAKAQRINNVTHAGAPPLASPMSTTKKTTMAKLANMPRLSAAEAERLKDPVEFRKAFDRARGLRSLPDSIDDLVQAVARDDGSLDAAHQMLMAASRLVPLLCAQEFQRALRGPK